LTNTIWATNFNAQHNDAVRDERKLFCAWSQCCHANGIDVIQDMVWNHLNGAGSENGGAGGPGRLRAGQ